MLVVLVLVGGAGAAQAKAPKRSFVVLDLKAPPLMVNLGRTVSLAVAIEAKKLGYRVLTSLDVAEKLGPAASQKAIDCGADAACVVAALKGLGVDRIIAGTFTHDETHYKVRMIHVDVKTGQVVSHLERDVLIASRELGRDMKEAAPDLLKGEPERTGTLVVESKVPNAEVRIDGRVVGKTPKVSVQLQPGKHQVHVSATDYLAEDRYVEVVADQTTHFVPRLFLQPGKSPPVVVAKKTKKTKKPKAGLPGLRLPWTTWASLGAGAVATGLGVYFGVQARGVQAKAIDANHDGVIDITRMQALSGKTDATVANILYGAAGVTVVAAAIFAVLAPQGPAASPGGGDGMPQVGAVILPGGAAVTVGGHF